VVNLEDQVVVAVDHQELMLMIQDQEMILL
jgi:hypothetical protein